MLVVRGQLEAQLTHRAANLQCHLQTVAVVALPPNAPVCSGVGSRAAQQQRLAGKVSKVDAAGAALAVDALQLDNEVHTAADVRVVVLALHEEGELGKLGLLRHHELRQLDSDVLRSEDLGHGDFSIIVVVVTLMVDTSNATEAQRCHHLAVGLQRVAVDGERVLAAADDDLTLGVGLEGRVGIALRTRTRVLERLGRLTVAIVLHAQRD